MNNNKPGLLKWIDKHYTNVIVGLGLIIYLNSFFNGFIGDDYDQIVNNSLVHSPLNLFKFFSGGTFFTGYSNQAGIFYKPLLSFVFSLLYLASFSGAFIFHLASVLLHIVSTLLVFKLFKRFFSEKVSFALALIFLVHPVNAESVLYISALQEALFEAFGLLGLLGLLGIKTTPRRYILSAVCFLLALLSKETGLLFILVSFVYIGLFNRKELFKGFLISNSLVLVIYLALRVSAVGLYSQGLQKFPISSLDLAHRLINIPEILTQYFNLFIFPKDLAFAQNWVITTASWESFYLPLGIVISLAAILIIWGASLRNTLQFKTFIFFLIWLVLGLSLHLQIFPLDMTFAERWAYMPIVGALGLLGVLGLSGIKIRLRPGLSVGIAFFVIALLSVRTFIRTFDFRDNFTLYSHDVLVRGDSYNLQNGLGNEYISRGDYKSAKPYILESIKLKPDYCYSWNNLGMVYLNEESTSSAKEAFNKAVNNGGCYLAYQNMVTFMYFHGEPAEAETFDQKALKALPYDPKIWFMYSLTEAKLGKKDQAIEAILKSNQLSPSNGTAYVYKQLMNNQPIQIKEK